MSIGLLCISIQSKPSRFTITLFGQCFSCDFQRRLMPSHTCHPLGTSSDACATNHHVRSIALMQVAGMLHACDHDHTIALLILKSTFCTHQNVARVDRWLWTKRNSHCTPHSVWEWPCTTTCTFVPFFAVCCAEQQICNSSNLHQQIALDQLVFSVDPTRCRHSPTSLLALLLPYSASNNVGDRHRHPNAHPRQNCNLAHSNTVARHPTALALLPWSLLLS